MCGVFAGTLRRALEQRDGSFERPSSGIDMGEALRRGVHESDKLPLENRHDLFVQYDPNAVATASPKCQVAVQSSAAELLIEPRIE